MSDLFKDINEVEHPEKTPVNHVVKEKTQKKEKTPDENIVYISFLETNEYILEQFDIATHATHATHNRRSQFVKYDKALGSMEVVDHCYHNNNLYYPISDDLLDNNVVLLPGYPQEYGETSDLVKEIKEFLKEYFQVPPFFESLLPYLVLFYWVFEKFPFVPYIQFLGRTGTGKSTAMEVLGSICYKPIDASGAITMASLFRVAALWKGTLLLDEFNPGGDSYQEMLALLKSGVSDRAVLRVEGDKKKEVKAYMVKSPKMFTSENPVNDAGFRSRIIEIRMQQNRRPVPLYRLNNFLDKARNIRSKLLLWRLRHLNEIDLKDIEAGYPELKIFQGRVQQVLTPIYHLADEEAKKEILEFAVEQQEETLRERRDAMEGQVFEEIMVQYHNYVEPTLSGIAEVINKKNKYPVTERKLATIVRKLLGFQIERKGHEKVSTVLLEDQDDKIKELCEYYGISLLRTSAASVARAATGTDANGNVPQTKPEETTMEYVQDLFGAIPVKD